MTRSLPTLAVLLCAAPAFAQVSPCPNGTCPTARPSYVVQPYGFAASQVSYGVPSYGSTLPAGVVIRDVVGRGPTLVKVGVGGAPDVFLDGASQAPTCSGGSCPTLAPGQQLQPISLSETPAGSADALDILNGQRAKRGLPAYTRDEGLTVAAQRAAEFRAKALMFDHTANDFRFLPQGTTADAAGCAAYESRLGFLACESYSTEYRFAGAAGVIGSDGKTYWHLFLRK